MSDSSRVQRWREGKRQHGLKAVTVWLTQEEELQTHLPLPQPVSARKPSPGPPPDRAWGVADPSSIVRPRRCQAAMVWSCACDAPSPCRWVGRHGCLLSSPHPQCVSWLPVDRTPRHAHPLNLSCVCTSPFGQPCRSPRAALLSGSPAALLAAATASQPLRPQAPSGRCWPAACLLHPALASRWRGWGRVPGGAGEHGRGAGRRRRGCT
jgi:hypothetical protein